MQKKITPRILYDFYYHGILVEQLKQQKVKGAAVHSPVYKLKQAVLWTWSAGMHMVPRLYADL